MFQQRFLDVLHNLLHQLFVLALQVLPELDVSNSDAFLQLILYSKEIVFQVPILQHVFISEVFVRDLIQDLDFF